MSNASTSKTHANQISAQNPGCLASLCRSAESSGWRHIDAFDTLAAAAAAAGLLARILGERKAGSLTVTVSGLDSSWAIFLDLLASGWRAVSCSDVLPPPYAHCVWIFCSETGLTLSGYSPRSATDRTAAGEVGSQPQLPKQGENQDKEQIPFSVLYVLAGLSAAAAAAATSGRVVTDRSALLTRRGRSNRPPIPYLSSLNLSL